MTNLGLTLVTRFRAIERAAEEAASPHLVALQVEVERIDTVAPEAPTLLP